MRKVTTFIAIAAVTANLAVPVWAADFAGGGMFNPTTALGWRQTNGTSAMAYLHVPFAGQASVARVGLRIAGPTSAYPGQPNTHLDGARVFDLSVGHGLSASSQNGWATTLALGNAVAWSSDRSAAPGDAPRLFESGLTWVGIGLLSAGAIAGAFALTNRKNPGN